MNQSNHSLEKTNAESISPTKITKGIKSMRIDKTGIQIDKKYKRHKISFRD